MVQQDNSYKRHPNENVRGFLISTLSTALCKHGHHTIHKFCDLYEHARHDPTDFKVEEYEVYSKLLLKLIDTYI
jgi:hypothetical protein